MPGPNYGNLGDHTETVQVDYDPRRMTYTQLLDLFWESHQPSRQSWSRQYRNAIFFHNEEQRLQASASRAAVAQKIGRDIKTEVAPLRTFTMAEDYHQKYTLKRDQVLRNEMIRIYPNPTDFVNSTAVSRLNGYAGGYGSDEQLAREIESLGLSAGGKKRLADLFRK